MFNLFKKPETDDQLIARIHAATIEAFSSLGINAVIAKSHKDILAGLGGSDECNLLVLVAYRTLFLATGVARHRTLLETQNETLANRVSNSILNESSLREIVRIIQETVPYSGEEPLNLVGKEANSLFQAATLFDRYLRQDDILRARKVWIAAVEADYVRIPLIHIEPPAD